MTPELHRAVTQTLRACGIRLRPDAQIGELTTYLEKQGVILGTVGQQLTATMNGTPADVATVLTALTSKPELKKNFVVPTAEVTHLSDLVDAQSKSAFISANGFDAYSKLVSESKTPKLGPVNLSPDATRADAQRWTRQEKVDFITQYGDAAYATILARK
jgi:hypothetical protein